MPLLPLSRSRFAWLTLALGGAVTTAALAAPIVHEFVPPDPREDLQLGATTTVGDLPAAIETPGGLVSAPDPFRAPGASDKAYSRSAEGQTFVPDRDTRAVQQVDYDDPFSPSIAPFKRLNSFDAVGGDSAFRVADGELRRVGVGGNVQLNEDPFYGDLTVDLVAGEAVRIPSVGPSMRILRLHTIPQVAVEVLRDGADNYYLRGPSRQRARVLLQVAVARSSLGGALRDALWNELPASPALPASLQAAAEEANRSIGVGRFQGYREVVERLVDYYRGFTTTEEPLPARGNIFLDIALSKKGVCRHRAYAFVISALALRIPARMVTNEAHAWVEVHDGQLWHRIDLGGAALNFHDNLPPDQI
ncbi:MAG: transglutaminase family protein, partial [Myxococcales bacterium]